MKRLSPITTLLVGLLLPGLSCAEYGERWFNVEAIIFVHNDPTAVLEEKWPEDPGMPDMQNLIDLIPLPEPEVTTEVQPQPLEELELRLPGQVIEFEELPLVMLEGAHARLQRSSRYEVKYARAWRLPDLPVNLSPPVKIQAGLRYLPDGELAPPLPDPDAPVQPIPLSLPADTSNNAIQAYYDVSGNLIDNALYEIEGRIKISLSKYLDVDADLLYRAHVVLPDKEGFNTPQFRTFRLTEFRRMRSKTLHYLDNPLFGLLIGIDRYEPPEVSEEDALISIPAETVDPGSNRQPGTTVVTPAPVQLQQRPQR